jgi:hypothetical protein
MKRLYSMGLLVLFVCGGIWSATNRGARPETRQSGTPAATKQNLEINFTGPWSFAKDTANGRIVAIAPDMQGHSPLYLRATGSVFLTAGVYDLVLNGGAAGAGSSSSNPKFVPAQLSASDLARLESNYLGAAYIINLPATADIHAVYNDPLAYSGTFPVPKPAISKNFATKVVFRYLVDETEIELDNKDASANPHSQSLDSEGTIDVGIDDDPDQSNCDYVAKTTYAAMTKLLKITQYIDFPPYDPACQPNDPQHPANDNNLGKMRHDSTAGSELMRANLLKALEELRSYAESLSRTEANKEEVKRIVNAIAEIENGVKSWAAAGATGEQKRPFVLQLNRLQTSLSKSPLSQSARDKLSALTSGVVPLSVSGKNCKAPLMLMKVTP